MDPEFQRQLDRLERELHREERKAAKRQLRIEAVRRLLVLMEPYVKINPDITVGEVMKLEGQRILDALEKDL